MARAVDCRAVIIYGGREHSSQTGYICNENLNSFVQCAPCWRWNKCDYDRKCMRMITPENILEALQKVINKKKVPLETETVTIQNKK
jgi:ADP-heptose:LPS heptosyltransferase